MGCAICDFLASFVVLGGPRTGPFLEKKLGPTSGRPAYISAVKLLSGPRLGF